MELLGDSELPSNNARCYRHALPGEKYEVTVLIFTLARQATVQKSGGNTHIRAKGFRVWFLMSAYRRGIIC